ncbi:MAG: hypothetical protein P4L03_03460 [Terracidiphilus sp.]|nr:hypothetical protein [Terracidiphilus sp.]
MTRTSKLNPAQESTMCLIRSTAESLWDVAETIFSTGMVRADDWEEARLAASHLLAALEHPPASTPLAAWMRIPKTGKPA